ncbi:sterol desaturase family protein [Notoacmeibacter sp. MSK16QG-6]|uniref:sterol desaturase family protein n=1 Tax=Notoacmeibacter sp. MSK16QG-6 TaxID=2957982 RepID=UPI0020A0D208|nr:sterol desaturase family protein [Notoacmeibacter sp. MSK16QG-6]MCP1198637.1 sterol desaturase family protein [Notoacmeibacter sp. MSK16QG-6]
MRKRIRLLLSHHGVIAMLVLLGIGIGIVATHFTWTLLAVIPFGVAAQITNEYLIHRFVFHLPPPRSQFWFDVLYEAHYGHHDFPSAERLLFVPVWFAVPMAFINLGVFWGIMALLGVPSPFVHAAALVLVGGVATFIAYEWFHMVSHLPVKRSWIEQKAATSHAQHHFRDFTKNYHVTPGGEVVDHMFGTAVSADELREKSRAEFMTTLGLRPDDPRLLSARSRIARRMGVGAEAIARQSRVAERMEPKRVA